MYLWQMPNNTWIWICAHSFPKPESCGSWSQDPKMQTSPPSLPSSLSVSHTLFSSCPLFFFLLSLSPHLTPFMFCSLTIYSLCALCIIDAKGKPVQSLIVLPMICMSSLPSRLFFYSWWEKERERSDPNKLRVILISLSLFCPFPCPGHLSENLWRSDEL